MCFLKPQNLIHTASDFTAKKTPDTSIFILLSWPGNSSASHCISPGNCWQCELGCKGQRDADINRLINTNFSCNNRLTSLCWRQLWAAAYPQILGNIEICEGFPSANYASFHGSLGKLLLPVFTWLFLSLPRQKSNIKKLKDGGRKIRWSIKYFPARSNGL